MAHLVDLFVDGRVLLNIGIALGNVGLGLVVVVVADKIADRVVGEEFGELAVQLGGKRLVGGDDEGRPVCPSDDMSHRKGLARAGDAEQDLMPAALVEACKQILNRLRLVALGLKLRNELKCAFSLHGRPF